MDDQKKLQSILKMADPQANSSHQERKVALNKAHEIMDRTGMSYASVGMSQADAERIETQFSVATPFKKKTQPKETRVSIFSRGGEIAVSDHPHYTSQPARKKPIVQVPDWEAENERKQWDESNRRYADWEKWRHAEDVKQAKSDADAMKFIRNVAITLILVVIVGVFVFLSQNAVIISAVTLVAKIFAAIFVALLAFFGFFVLR